MAGAAFIPIGLCISLKNPFALCLAFILFSFFRLHEAFPQLGPLRLPLILALGSIGTLGILSMFRRIKFAWTPELKHFLVFFGFVTLMMFVATDRSISITYWKDSYSKMAIMVFAIATLTRTPGEFRLACRSFVVAGGVIAAVAVHNEWAGIGLVEGTRVTIGRDIGSAIGDPNDLSLVLLFPLSFALAIATTSGSGRWARLLSLAAGGTMVLGILYTGSRGGLMGSLAVCGALASQRVKNKKIIWLFAAAAVLVLLLLAGMRGGGTGGGVGQVDESSQGRIEAWMAAWRMAVSHPLTGVGLENFKYNFFFYTTYWEGFAKAVHSTWFCALAETGFIGFGIFLSMVIRTAKTAVRASTRLSRGVAGDSYDVSLHVAAQAITSGLAGFCVSGTFLTQAFTWPLYILLGLTVAVSRASEGISPSGSSTKNGRDKVAGQRTSPTRAA